MSLQKLQQRVLYNQVVSILGIEDTAALCPPQTECLQTLTQFFKRQSARFPQNFYKASKCLQIPLLKPKNELGSTKSKNNLFPQNYDINEHPNSQTCFSFRFGNNNSCAFSIKKFELDGNQFNFTEIVELNHREIHLLYKIRYYVDSKCEIFENIYVV